VAIVPKIKYKDISLGLTALAMVKAVNRIIADYQAQGYMLTLRQVYYQLVAHDLFPEDRKWRWTGTKWIRDENGTKNAEPNYKWLGSIVNDGRLAGLIDWSAIEDRTRELRGLSHWTSPSEIIEAVARQFHIDMWEGQKFQPEVWVEKDALVGVIERVCNELDVPHFSCRGYTSQSEMWAGAMRLRDYAKWKKRIPFIFHLGDHDPSGKDMTRDIEDRLEMFMGGVKLERLALNMDQIEQYDPPPNPAKLTDSRCGGYIAEFGNESWELDALEPAVITELIRAAVNQLINKKAWKKKKAELEEHRRLLKAASDRWEEVTELLEA
jgi:hypothetical protein